MKRILVILTLILALGLLFADAMPDFRLSDMNGKTVTLESLLGKGPILIDFWADYCNPCKVAMPYLHELAEKYPDLTVVLISIDAPKAQMRAKNYLKSKDYKFLTLFDPEKSLAKRLNVGTPPHSFILNKTGEIVFSHVGFEPGNQVLYENTIKHLLCKGKKEPCGEDPDHECTCEEEAKEE
ncbi:MAG: TlpA disulfide reductase family protein [Candidatus Cloacimonetes bacterium]|jgi:thiol-disulfide isomerase/thioredoxin|nr:TlpA disulfide reductase family protein [Candidatus Cloacimonadota bacterium]MDD3562682.1 TlpA disulfide reductase family protein [Candidatus Cloacimonadota bacterium]MDY0326456.1 TlpA disulfide reductase family protein [Candidatus Cloacimonadaceae bacterium]